MTGRHFEESPVRKWLFLQLLTTDYDAITVRIARKDVLGNLLDTRFEAYA